MLVWFWFISSTFKYSTPHLHYLCCIREAEKDITAGIDNNVKVYIAIEPIVEPHA